MKVKSLASKIFLALAAIAVPAFAVAGFLGWTLISTVSEVEEDVERALAATRQIGEIRVMLEKEHGDIARLAAEFDQTIIDVHYASLKGQGSRIHNAVETLAASQRIVSASQLSTSLSAPDRHQ